MKSSKDLKVIGLVAIVLIASLSVYAKKVTGNGNVIKDTRKVESFNVLKCNGIVDVYLSQGDMESVVVETDENLQEYLITEFNNGVLTISNPKGTSFRNSPKINVYLTVKDIKEMDFNGVGDLECATELKLKTLKISNKGVGKLELKGTVDDLSIWNSGVGSIKAGEFVSKKAYLKNSGVGAIKINATESIKIINNGVGRVVYTGDAKMVDIESNGIGGIHKK